MTTLSDVAARAGVSKATASRALNRPDLVAPGTVERVRAAAAELRFVPNRGAQHLARGRSGIVSVVVPTLQNSFFTPIIAGAQTRAESAGIHVTVAVHPLQDEAGAARFEHLAAQVDGLIVVAPRGDDELVRRACALKPGVLVDREIEAMPSVSADTAGAFAALVERLADEGHERVAFLNGPEMSWQSGQRTAAVQEAAARLGIEVVVIGPSPATFAAGVALADDVIATGATVALPYASDLGLGLLFELVSRGRARFGEADAARAAGSDEPPTTRHAIEVVGVPGAAAVDVDGEALGEAAMDHLWTLLGGGTPDSLQVRLPVPVAERWAGPRGRA
ncbi:MAG: LacI family DNA-binding transcriptional regulator [Actinomycetaceae bacterium]